MTRTLILLFFLTLISCQTQKDYFLARSESINDSLELQIELFSHSLVSNYLYSFDSIDFSTLLINELFDS